VKLRPLNDHLVAVRVEPKDKSEVGMLVIPDSAKEKPMTAKVVAIGTGRMLDDGKRLPLEIEKGAKVLIGKYAGSEVELDGVEYLILREDDVLGTIV
jgi:chaperonin GroES